MPSNHLASVLCALIHSTLHLAVTHNTLHLLCSMNEIHQTVKCPSAGAVTLDPHSFKTLCIVDSNNWKVIYRRHTWSQHWEWLIELVKVETWMQVMWIQMLESVSSIRWTADRFKHWQQVGNSDISWCNDASSEIWTHPRTAAALHCEVCLYVLTEWLLCRKRVPTVFHCGLSEISMYYYYYSLSIFHVRQAVFSRFAVIWHFDAISSLISRLNCY